MIIDRLKISEKYKIFIRCRYLNPKFASGPDVDNLLENCFRVKIIRIFILKNCDQGFLLRKRYSLQPLNYAFENIWVDIYALFALKKCLTRKKRILI